ncbi:leucine-rich repeat domain-containing protein [Polaribacter staleyi]|uniref:leucine-rich repeat domain-containing protein n=1 Tax=Polaribacter staleyi TaxID=2022337 RepID=UPI0031BA5B7B
MKKTLLLFITLLTITVTNAQLVLGDTFEGPLFKYTVSTAEEAGSENTVSITGTIDGATVPDALVIPATVTEGGIDYAVTLIANQAFKDAAITSLVIEGETTIGNQSFWGAKSLISVSAPLSSIIFNQAFRSCESLTDVNIPKVVSIGVQSFRACTSLKSIDIPSATTLGAGVGQGLTFWQSTALETVNMPVMDSISVGAFNGCSSLKSITFPASLTKLDQSNYNMFKGCTSLTEVNIEYTTFIPLTKDAGHVNVSIFNDVTANATLSIPASVEADYIGAEVWQDFSKTVLGVNSPEKISLGSYPNPVVDYLHFSSKEVYSVEIYNILGARVSSQKVVNRVDMTNLNKGVYIVKAKNDEGLNISSIKVIKQ